MFTFSIFAWILLAVVFIVCIIVLVILRKRIRVKINSGEKNQFRKYSTIYIIIGFLLIVLSVVLIISMYSDNLRGYKILQTIATMTSEPLRAASLAGIFIGITILIVGIHFKCVSNSMCGE